MNILTHGTTATNKTFNVRRVPALLVIGGLAGAETVAVEIWNGVAFVPYEDEASAAVVASVGTYQVPFKYPGEFRLVKPVTAGSVSANLYQPDN